MLDNCLPQTAALLQRRYNEAMRARLEAVARELPELNVSAWPKRRTKRKPYPGTYDGAPDEEG